MRFEYLEPTTVKEAVSLLGSYGDKAKLLAGGTDLVVQMRQRLKNPQYVVSMGHIPRLDYIDYDTDHGLRIGALTTIRTIERSAELREKYPILYQAASQHSTVSVRNVATIGGNLCNASPAADMVPALVGLSAVVKIVGPSGERQVLLEDFFTGPGGTVLKADEVLVEIQVPTPPSHTIGTYLKRGIRGSADVAIVGVAAVVTLAPENGICKDVKIAIGSAAPTVIRARQAESVLRSKTFTGELIEQAAQIASDEAQPISDVRSSAEYRREMVKVFTRRALMGAVI